MAPVRPGRRRGPRPCRPPGGAARHEGDAMNSQILTWIVSLGAWNWFILAALLFLIEILAPGSFMLWLALSAILVGAISTAVVWSWQAPPVPLSGVAIASNPVLRAFSPTGWPTVLTP